jgi:hypothetical protein
MLGAAYLMQVTATSSLAFFKRTEREHEGYKKVFFLTSIVINFLPLGFIGIGDHGVYDRYLIPLFPLCMALISLQGTLAEVQLGRIGLELVGIFIIGVLSVCAAHDYLSWNRTRWEALRYLMHEKHVPPAMIDGGFEFNGWYLYREDYQKSKEDSAKSWYWVEGDTYAVALGKAPGYRVVRQYYYNRWLSLDRGSVYILEKQEVFSKDKQSPKKFIKPAAPVKSESPYPVKAISAAKPATDDPFHYSGPYAGRREADIAHHPG